MKKKTTLRHCVTCTRWLLGLALKGPWLGLGVPPPTLITQTGLENTRKAAWALTVNYYDSGDYCMLINEWAWSKSQVRVLRLEEDVGPVLESDLGDKWRYGALKACVC